MDEPDPTADFAVVDSVIELAIAGQRVQKRVNQWIGRFKDTGGRGVVGYRGLYA